MKDQNFLLNIEEITPEVKLQLELKSKKVVSCKLATRTNKTIVHTLQVGLEPTTNRLTVDRSTTELLKLMLT